MYGEVQKQRFGIWESSLSAKNLKNNARISSSFI